jgi:Tol biopolymer transport system component
LLGLSSFLNACSDDANATPDLNTKNLPKDRLLFLSNRDGWSDLYTMDLTGKITQRLTNSAEVEYGAVWSPDGRYIAYTALNGDQAEGAYQQHAVYVMASDGTNRKLVASNAFGPVWSPDSKRLLVTKTIPPPPPPASPTPVATPTYDIYATAVVPTPPFANTLQFKLSLALVEADGSNPSGQLLAANGLVGSWSPDGKQVAYIAGNNIIDQKRTLNLINSDGSGQLSLSNQARITNLDVLYVAWSPVGSQLAFSAIDPDMDKMSLYRISSQGGAPRHLADYAGSAHEAQGLIWGYADFANPAPRLHLGPVWSGNGQQLAFSAGGNQLVTVNADSGNQQFFPVGSAALGQDSDSVLNLSWEADNRHLLYDRASVGRNTLLQEAANYIYDYFDESLEVLDTVNKHVQTLSNEAGSFVTPTCCGMDLLGAATATTPNTSIASPSSTASNATNPNQGKLVYTSGIGQRQLIVNDLKSGQHTVLSSGNFRSLEFGVASSGDRLAYLNVGSGFQATLYVTSFDGKQKRQLSQGNGAPNDFRDIVSWSPDGKKLAFKALNGDASLAAGLYIFNVEAGYSSANAPLLVTKENVSAFGWSPDSVSLAYKVERETYTLYIVPANNPPLYPNPAVRIGIANSQYASLERGIAWSPDGTMVAFGGSDSTGHFSLWLYDPQGQNAAIPGPIISRIYDWSPDGTHLMVLVATATQSTEIQALAIQNYKGLWRSYGEGIGPIASPDSAYMVFYTQHNLPNDFYFANGVVNSGGSYALDQPYLNMVTFKNGYQTDIRFNYPPYFGFKGHFYSWSPDAKNLAYYENNTIFITPAGLAQTGQTQVLARAFAVDRLVWVK